MATNSPQLVPSFELQLSLATQQICSLTAIIPYMAYSWVADHTNVHCADGRHPLYKMCRRLACQVCWIFRVNVPPIGQWTQYENFTIWSIFWSSLWGVKGLIYLWSGNKVGASLIHLC